MQLPSNDTAETIEHLVTAVGILLAGAWAFWRWSLSEYLRHRREIPSFDGEISARVVPLDDGRCILTVSCKWRNCGVKPLLVNTQETHFSVFEVPPNTPHGPIGPRLKNLMERFVRRPWEHWPSVIIEPGTTSELQAHFLVEADHAYVISCRLEAVRQLGEPKQVWVRELAWSSKSRERA